MRPLTRPVAMACVFRLGLVVSTYVALGSVAAAQGVAYDFDTDGDTEG